MKISALLVLCALLVAASAQTITITSPSTTIYYGVQSDWFFVTATVFPESTITVSLSDSLGSGLSFSPNTVTLTPQSRQASFRVTGTKAVNIIQATLDNTAQGFVFSAVGGQYSVAVSPRPVSFDGLLTSGSPSIPVGLPTEPFKVYVVHPSNSALTFTPTLIDNLDGTTITEVEFHPSTITIPAGQLSASFYIIGKDVYTSISGARLEWTQSDYNLYGNISNVAYTSFSVTGTRSFYVTPFSARAILGATSNTMYFWAQDRANDSLTITPQAADVTFSPSSATLNLNNPIISFTYKTTSAETTKPVYFYTSDAASTYYVEGVTTSVASPKINFLRTVPSLFIVTKPTKVALRLEYPATNDVTVTLFAANLQFSPSSVTFNGATTGQEITVTPINTGGDIISYLVTGTDAAWYNTPADVSVTISKGSILGPSEWYVPRLFVGQESDKLPIRLNVAPANKITITPSAPDVVFNPATLEFDSDNVEQWVTITPTVARTHTIDFLVNGDDYAWFPPPSSVSVTSQLRQLQAVWSADIEEGTTTTLYLGKDYTVWVSTNFVGRNDKFTVTPVNAYFKFSPESLTFDSGSFRNSFTATPLGAGATVASSTISYIISGDAAGYYPGLSSSFALSLRPFNYYSAVIGLDDRHAAGHYVNATYLTQAYGRTLPQAYNDVAATLSSYHVFSFSLSTTVFPGSSLTITPKSPHVSFSPSSYTLHSGTSTTIWTTPYVTVTTNGYSEETYLPTYLAIANFSATAYAPGSHDIYFELSGDDAQYYDTPDHITMLFRKYSNGGSGSSTVVASVGMIVASIVFALFF